MLPAGIVLRASLVGLVAVLLAAGCSPGCGRLCQPGFWETAGLADVEAELEAGADVNGSRPPDFNSPLHLAIEYRAGVDVVALLLKHGANPNASGYIILSNYHGDGWSKSHRTPLQLAIEQYNRPPAIIESLLDHGADPNPKTDGDFDGEAPLYYASRLWYEGDRAIIELLLEHGADIGARDPNGLTPFHRAMYEADPAVITLLLDYGADIHARTNSENYSLGGSFATPLHQAAEASGYPESITTLLDHGADIHAKDEEGNTPLHLATSNQNNQVVALLLDRGADINTENKDGDTPLHLAIYHDRSPDIIPLLLAQGADINVQNKYGDTPLNKAIERSPAIIPILLEHGADVNIQNINGITPLHRILFWNTRPEVVALLLEHGADVNAKTKTIVYYVPGLSSATPLHWAAQESSSEIIALLLDRGADLTAQNELRETPCQSAKGTDRPTEILRLVCR